MKLDLTQAYKRIDNILYCNDIAIVKFTHSKFPDIDPLTEQGVKYMQSYIDVWSKHGYFEILPGCVASDEAEQNRKTFNLDFEQPIPEWSDLKQTIENVANEVKSVSFEDIRPKQNQEAKGSMAFIEMFNNNTISESHNPNDSRLDQVRFWFNKGLTSASKVAEKIDANPSYVQRLLKQVKDESTK